MAKKKDTTQERARCEFEDGCNCHRIKTTLSCESCHWYRMFDSGYGTCNVLPTHLLVAWCKEPCSLFKNKVEGYRIG